MIDGPGSPVCGLVGLRTFAMVGRMSEQHHRDPSGNTEQFRAFVQSTEPARERSLPVGLIGGVAAAVVVLIAVVVWVVMS
jgi:hypothetical protein